MCGVPLVMSATSVLVPPHVQSDDVPDAALRGQSRGAHDPAHHAGVRDGGGQPRGAAERRQAAITPHDVAVRRHAAFGRGTLERIQMVDDGLLDEGVHACRAGALELAKLPHHVAGEGDIDIGADFRRQLGDAGFMGRVRVGVQEAHRQAAHAGRLQLAQHLARLLLVQCRNRASLVIHPFAYGKAQMARHQRAGGAPMYVVDVRLARCAADLQHIAKSLCRQQGDARLFLLDNQVGHVGRGVHEPGDHVQVQPGGGAYIADAIQDADIQILRRGGHFKRAHLIAVDQHHVGVGAAGVDADADLGGRRR